MVGYFDVYCVWQQSQLKSVVEPTAGDHMLLHAKDEIARLKLQLKSYQTKEKEVIFGVIMLDATVRFLVVLCMLRDMVANV